MTRRILLDMIDHKGLPLTVINGVGVRRTITRITDNAKYVIVGDVWEYENKKILLTSLLKWVNRHYSMPVVFNDNGIWEIME